MVSHPRCDDLLLTHLTVQHKESVYIRGKEKSKRFSPRVHVLHFLLGEDDISFSYTSHLQRANSNCTPSCS